MQHCHATIRPPPLYLVSAAQLAVLAPVLFVVFWLQPLGAKALAMGASIEMAARLYFGFYAFRYIGARQMQQVARAFRQGAVGKFVLVVVLFGLVFAYCRWASPLLIFSGYVLAWILGSALSAKLISTYRF